MAGCSRAVLLTVAATALALVTVVGCSSASPRSPYVSSPAKSSAPAATSSPAPGSAASCGGGQWQTAPVTVSHSVTVPPVPTITAVRTAQHPECGYDRVVLDFTGSVPGYTIQYASQVVADASGAVIALPGQRYLIVTLRPAQAHTNGGVATISPAVQVLGFPAVKSWVLAGDFEGVVHIAIGLPGQVSFRAGELAGRLYIDVKE